MPSRPSTPRPSGPGRGASSAIPEKRIAVGIIRKAHGVHGEASVESWGGSPERFEELDAVYLISPGGLTVRAARIEGVRFHGRRVLVTFSGIDSPEQLRDLQNWTIEIDAAEARKLEPGEYFLHDLVGLRLVDAGGADRGVVRDAYEGGGGVLLEIERLDGGTFDLPFAAAICTNVDLATKRMIVDLPEGIDDLDKIESVEDEARRRGSTASAEPRTISEPAVDPRLRVDLVTIFPKMFEPLLAEGVLARGIKAGILDVRLWDLRDFATDKHRSTDDEAYGGGPGMVMLAEPVLRCVDRIRSDAPDQPSRILMTSPQGRLFDHAAARELATERWLIILCGRYEGFDERIRVALSPEEISIGDFVVSGGELPAMLMIDAIGRMIEGVVGNNESVAEDSFFNGLLDYPHYTRPEEIRGMRVPDILLSGHHEKIRKWRKEQSLRQTLEKRPDLLEKADLDDEARTILEKIRKE